MASAPRVTGADKFGVFPPSSTRSGNPELPRRPSYCNAAFALKQIAKVTANFLHSRFLTRGEFQTLTILLCLFSLSICLEVRRNLCVNKCTHAGRTVT